MIDYKTCTGPCGQSKPLHEFVRRRNAPDGYASICRVCLGDKHRATRTPPKEVKQKKHPAVVLQDRHCTCTPRQLGEYIAHDAGCMIFAHNQLDGLRRGSSLEPAPQPFGTRRLWK